MIKITFHKYRKIYTIGHDENKDIFTNPEDEIIIEEKIDGGNFRFMINGSNIIIGSRSQQLTDNDGNDTNMNKNFIRCANYIREKLKDKDLKLLKGKIFYGENCIKHTMAYDWNKIPPYLGFDIFDLHSGKFLREKNQIFSNIGLDVVPQIEITQAKNIKKIDDNLVPNTMYPSSSTKDLQAEGIVFKNYNKQIFAKYVRDKFKEENKKVFGGSPKYNKVDDTNNSEFIFKYCTNQRIDKIIFKLIDEGMKLDITMMSELPRRVHKDIWIEHWQDIRDSNWKLDMPKLRKLIPKRCVEILKQVIINNSLI